MDKGKVTIYDVADAAGVAISTVSRVLNDSHEVSDETRSRVLKAIEALNFRPDRTAKMLAQKQTGWLTVAVPSSTSQVYNELLKGVKDCLRQNDIDMLLCNMGSVEPKKTLWKFLNRGAVDALLLASLPVDERLASELKSLQAPVVLLGARSAEFDSFYWDNVLGGRLAVEHLISLGHTKIGMIAALVWNSDLADSRIASDRIEGYRQALEHAGLPYNPALVQAGDTKKHAGFSEEAGYEAMQKLLRIEPGLTAAFATSDVQAYGAMKALREAGKRIPEDFSLIGYDNIKTSRYIGLSSVDQQLLDVGYQATELLLQLRDGTREPVKERPLTPKLAARSSTARVA